MVLTIPTFTGFDKNGHNGEVHSTNLLSSSISGVLDLEALLHFYFSDANFDQHKRLLMW